MSLLDRWMALIEDRAVTTETVVGSAGTEFRAGVRLAAHGAVTQLEVTPGLIEADVDDRSSQRATIGLAPLDDVFWARLSKRVGANPSWQIQLDAHVVPEALALEFLPESVVLRPGCTCGAGSSWCRHVVGVAAAFAETLATDPFAVATALGSNRDVILGTPTPHAVMPYGLDKGVSAGAAYRKTPAEAPRVPPPAAQHRTPISLSIPAPAGSGIAAEPLLDAIEDASRRAHELLTGATTETSLNIPVGLDVIRRAAHGDPEAIGAQTGLDPTELAAAAGAWRVGGAAAVRVLRDRWECPADRLEPAIGLLGGDAKVRANTVSASSVQLRLDRAGLWWRFRHDETVGWKIEAGPASTVADVMALAPDDREVGA